MGGLLRLQAGIAQAALKPASVAPKTVRAPRTLRTARASSRSRPHSDRRRMHLVIATVRRHRGILRKTRLHNDLRERIVRALRPCDDVYNTHLEP